MSKPGIIIQCTFYCASADAAACSVVVRQSLCSRVSHRLAEIRSCIQPRLRTIKRMTFHYLEDLHTPTYGSIRGREVPACIHVTQSRSFFSPSSSLFRWFSPPLPRPLHHQLDTHAAPAFRIRRASLPTIRRFNPFTLLSGRIRHAEDASVFPLFHAVPSFNSSYNLRFTLPRPSNVKIFHKLS